MAHAELTPVPVTFVSSHALGGGSERYLELLLAELGPDWVRGLVVLQEGPFVERMRALGHDPEVIVAGPRAGMLAAALRLRRTLKRRRPAIVHANGVKAALVAVLATPGTGIPVLWLKHDYSWDGRLARAIASRCRAVVAVSGAIVETFGPRQRRKVSVVPNGVPELAADAAAGRARALEAAGAAGADARLAVLVGRLHPAKGQIELIEAAPGAIARVPATRFLLLGGEDPTQAEYARRLRSRVAELGIEDAVRFAGHRDDVLDLIAGSDLMVLPSVPDERGFGREACPFALLEAMALGTPVVAYADGGVPEVFGDCDGLVPPGDRDALAAAIARVLDDAGAREEMAACGRRRVSERHSLAAMVGAMRERYAAAARP